MKIKMPIQTPRFIKPIIWIVAVVILLINTSSAVAGSITDITVYRDPACNCCGNWVDYLATQGFQPKNLPVSNIVTLKQHYGVPNDLVSCHTAVIDGYIVEGHVPVEDIKRLLTEKPDVVGIAVPDMPIGTPGMESGDVREPFSVFSFGTQGTKLFNQYVF